jgi:TolB-like protein/class 3 adenylate cyclase
MTATRRLAAILAADVAGYSRLIGADEEGTLSRLRSIRAEVIDPKVSEHRGRIVKTTGDGLLVEFASVIDALRCAIEWQTGMTGRKTDTSDRRIEFRIGINVGDVVVEDGDIFGDGVNVAARLEALAEPGGICVSARVQEDADGRLDLTFDDMGDQNLKNITRQVRVYRIRLATSEAPEPAPVETAPSLTLPDKPSIAVLPFENMSGDLEQEYFVDGMVEEIITALSRIHWLFVIARNSTYTYKGRAVDVKQVGRELGVRYVLEGSVRKAGERVRITGQLIDAATGTHLWADRFDGSLDDVFDLQDKVALSVAGVIEPALQMAETRRLAQRPTSDLTAYDLYLRALDLYFPITKQRVLEALGYLERAITIDRQFGPALAWAAVCNLRLVNDGWVAEHEEVRRRAIEQAREALSVGKNDPGVLANAAFVLARFGENISAMIALMDRALALNPSFARGWFLSGLMRHFAGQPDLTIQHVETSLRLSPRESVGTPFWLIGEAYFFKRQFELAEAKLLLAIQDNPGHPPAYRALAACYAYMGRLDDARAIIVKLRTLTPLVVYRDLPFLNPKDSEFLLSGLRLAAGKAA